MPAKTSKTKSSSQAKKTNVAKSSGLTKKARFNWKIAVVIGLILVAALGYLYVRLSRASGGYVWAPNDITVRTGQRVTKTDGTPAIQSVTSGNRQLISGEVNSNPTTTSGSYDKYCVRWKATETPNIEFDYYFDAIVRPATQKPVKALDAGTTGDYKNSCAQIPTNNRGNKRYVTFRLDAAPNASIGLYAVYRQGDLGFTPPERISNPNPAATPAASSLPPAPAPAQLNCASQVNGLGNQNPCVALIQGKLKALGYNITAVDGIYGTNTRDNVKIFQQKTGLAQDGIVGPITWNRLAQAQNCSDPAAKSGCTLGR